MNPWILLFFAIIIEVIGTTSLQYSKGFTKIIPSTIVVICFVIALYLMSVVTKSLPLGIVYAIWSGVGIILTAIIAFFAFEQKPDLPALIGMFLIIIGVLIIHLFSQTVN